MALGLRPFIGTIVGGSPPLDTEAGEELVRTESGAVLALGRRQPEPPGTLFITTRRVIWISNEDAGKGYEVNFLAITLHAVSRDPEAFPVPCIYTQIEADINESEELEESDSDGEQELSKITEMRIIPPDINQLDGLFDVFCQCAEMNPDPNAEIEEDSWLYGGEEMADVSGMDAEVLSLENQAHPIGQTNGDHDLIHSVVELSLDDQRFEDADEAENEP